MVNIMQRAAKWQQELAESITQAEELMQLLELSSTSWFSEYATKDFSLRVPRSFVARMEKGNPHDPLLKQILPSPSELFERPGFVKDPLAERDYNPVSGLLHKYENRVLLVVTGGCAVNCRYCFRRHFPYAENNPSRKDWSKSIEYIQFHSEIHEVILSGGDPLLAPDDYLSDLVAMIDSIPHVKRLRIHSRIPIVLPSRVNNDLLSWFVNPARQAIMVVHANHPNEINQEVSEAVQLLRSNNVLVLNQSVLLRDINDDPDILANLSEKLFSIGILPYYLHRLDPVKGAGHFEVNIERARQIVRALAGKVSGYLLPKFVQELPGENSKQLISLEKSHLSLSQKIVAMEK